MLSFNGAVAATVNIDVSAASQRVQIRPTGTTGNGQVRVMNDGTATVWIEAGGSAVTASLSTSVPVGPGVTEVLTFTGTHIAAIAAGATGTIYFTPGSGI